MKDWDHDDLKLYNCLKNTRQYTDEHSNTKYKNKNILSQKFCGIIDSEYLSNDEKEDDTNKLINPILRNCPFPDDEESNFSYSGENDIFGLDTISFKTGSQISFKSSYEPNNYYNFEESCSEMIIDLHASEYNLALYNFMID